MFTLRIFIKLIMVYFLTFSVLSCEKPAGPGGRATVKGKVFANDWENTQRLVLSRGYSAGERVYIIYGDQNIIGNDVRTGPDGSYEFKFLNKGHYKVYVNSLDTTIVGYKGNDTENPVMREFDIKKANETITLPDIVINK
jgi:hypothetical protein